MKHLILLLLTFAHGGHWFGGHAESVSIAWAAQSDMPAVVIHWDCTLGPVSLASGNADMADAAQPLNLSLTLPQVRVPTHVHFTCTARNKTTDAQVASGESDIVVYPDDLLGSFEKQYAGKKFVLVDHTKSLLKFVDRAKIHADLLTDCSQLAFQQPDVLIIAPDELKPLPLQPSVFLPMARKGCQVIVLRQSAVDSVAGYHLNQRDTGSGLNWRTDHAVLADLDSDTLQAWVKGSSAMAIQLPAEDASLELGYWQPEAPSRLSSPPPSLLIDALLMTRTLGTGRIVLCQLPTDDWADDPRSQILLHNLLSYATTRAEPTPPSIHPTTLAATAAAIPKRDILAPIGD